MTIEEFVEARLREMELKFEGLGVPDERRWDIQLMIANMYQVLYLHKNWPVLIQEQPYFETATDMNNVSYRMTQNFNWVTQEAYRKKFGTEPPTAPMIKSMAQMWMQHPDFDPNWAL